MRRLGLWALAVRRTGAWAPRSPWRATGPAPERWLSGTRAQLYIDPRKVAGRLEIQTMDDKLAQYVLDEAVEANQIRVKLDDGTLSEPRHLYDLLDSIDRSVHHVVQLQRPADQPWAVVQVLSRAALVKQISDQESRRRQVQQAQKDKKPKQLELNWAISANDLQLKLKQMEDFLRKGKKVELLLANKRRQRRATPTEAQALLGAIKDKMHEIGAIEAAPLEGGLLRQATMTVRMPQ